MCYGAILVIKKKLLLHVNKLKENIMILFEEMKYEESNRRRMRFFSTQSFLVLFWSNSMNFVKYIKD